MMDEVEPRLGSSIAFRSTIPNLNLPMCPYASVRRAVRCPKPEASRLRHSGGFASLTCRRQNCADTINTLQPKLAVEGQTQIDKHPGYPNQSRGLGWQLGTSETQPKYQPLGPGDVFGNTCDMHRQAPELQCQWRDPKIGLYDLFQRLRMSPSACWVNRSRFLLPGRALGDAVPPLWKIRSPAAACRPAWR